MLNVTTVKNVVCDSSNLSMQLKSNLSNQTIQMLSYNEIKQYTPLYTAKPCSVAHVALSQEVWSIDNLNDLNDLNDFPPSDITKRKGTADVN